jgi:hypothetical protein
MATATKRLCAVVFVLSSAAWALAFCIASLDSFEASVGQRQLDKTTFWAWIVTLAYIPGVPVVDYILTECHTIKKVIKWMFS